MSRTEHRSRRHRILRLALTLLPAAALAVPVPAGAAAPAVASTWRGVDPGVYDHATGGGHWSAGRPSLMPFSTAWSCGDVISYLLRLDGRPGAPTTAARVAISMTSDSTGRSGIALVPIPGGASIDPSDPAQSGDRDSSVTAFTATTSGTPLSPGATSAVAFTVTELGASETVIVRVDLRMICSDPTAATGNVHARLAAVTDLAGTESYLHGAQTVPARGARTRSATTSPVAPGVTTTTTTPPRPAPGPPVTTTTAPAGIPGGPTATTSTTTPDTTASTLPAEVLGEQAERTTGLGAGLAVTGGSLLLALLGLAVVAIGTWFVTGSRRRGPAAN
ncbi:MAG: hypothetical protein RL531_2010 [Actinomycetota bacterium]